MNWIALTGGFAVEGIVGYVLDGEWEVNEGTGKPI